MGHVFVSYSPADLAYVEPLVIHIVDNARISTWWSDYERVREDDRDRRMHADIATCFAVVVVMTPDSETSNVVNRTIDVAEGGDKLIFPLLLRGNPFPRLAKLKFEDVTDGRMPSQRFLRRLRDSFGLPPKPWELRYWRMRG